MLMSRMREVYATRVMAMWTMAAGAVGACYNVREVTVQTHPSSEVSNVPPGASGLRPVSAPESGEQHDIELVAAIARGDGDALRSLTRRMAPRVERVARALMGGSLDARDAALHALIELLRSHGNYRGKQRFERWGDRAAAVSVMRFARAVSARGKGAVPAQPALEPGSERGPRTFEQYLGMLGETSRHTLLLRHALGFGIGELADVMQCTPQSARERLLAARRELRALVRRRESDPPVPGGGSGAQRWSVLRDREALGGVLLPEEQEDLTLLEAKEPEVWAYVAQVRALELYFDTRGEPAAPLDDSLIERAVEAIEVISPTLKTRALVDVGVDETRSEREPSNWIGVFAWAASAALASASALALYWQKPQPEPPAIESAPLPALMAPISAPAPKPTVESMPSARTALRGAGLRVDGRLLAEGSALGQGDTLEAAENAGCLEIEPAFEVCLAPGSTLRLSALQAGSRQLTLLHGRVVVRGSASSELTRLSVVAEGVTASTVRGVLAFERASDAVRVRALRGPISLQTGRDEHSFQEGEGAHVRVADGTVTIAPVQLPLLQRDWDVLAAGLHEVAASSVSSVRPAKSHAARRAARRRSSR
jgi:RNA polymerase sigma-70 factor (ECF subfamily)